MGFAQWPVTDATSGTVTSVAMSVPAALLSLSGSPITSAGTLAVTLGTRAANLIFAGPVSGGDATPTFRSLVVADFNSGTSASSSTYWRGDGTWAAISATGDVVGPASSVDNQIVRFDSTTGKLIQTSGLILSDVAAGVYTMAPPDDAVADATAAAGVTITASSKTAGTGAGGPLRFRSGNSTGGVVGALTLGFGGASDANSIQFAYQGGATQTLAPQSAYSYAFVGATTGGLGYSSGAVVLTVGGTSNFWLGSNYAQFITSVHSDGTATKDFGAYNGTTLYPFRTAYLGTSLAIGIASGSIFTPNYHLDIRQATAANAVYQQFSITTTTGTASTDGTKVGLDSSGNFVINQQEALAINLQIGGTTTQSISSAGLVTIGASGGTQVHVINGATQSAGSDAMTLLNGPAGTAGNPDLFLKININGTAYVIPAWTPT